jgi:ubiquitin-conjugating enzyme E2 J2
MAVRISTPLPYLLHQGNPKLTLPSHSYILTGAPDTPYAGGQYWGTLIFPSDYPFAPPAIRMHTPSGRFQPSTRLCLSISDFHPKSFNPAWSVSTILIGLLSFMNSEEMTAGSLSASKHERRWHAARSRWWNSTGGGGTTTRPLLLNAGPKPAKGPGSNNIKAGDGGKKFRDEWAEEDTQNWDWMEEVGVDPASGRVAAAEELEDEAREASECGPEIAKLRKILRGGANGSGVTLGQAAREAGESWLGRWKWYLLTGFVAYVIASRVIFVGDD